MDEEIIKELLEPLLMQSMGTGKNYTWKDFKKDYIKKQKELAQAEKIKRIPCHLGFIGKCYKFRNSYNPSEKWWLYIQIIGVDKDGNLIIHKFQKSNYGRIEIESETSWSDFDSDYIPISEKEYKKATGLILQEITDQRVEQDASGL